MIRDRGTVAGNVYDKYGTQNPIARVLVTNFLRSVRSLVTRKVSDVVVEIGSGEGELLPRLLGPNPVGVALGSDLSPRVVAIAAQRNPTLSFVAQSAYELALRDRSVDLMIACEVLEHLDRPEAALRELARVTRGRVILSVPREPIWRLLNLARGRYLRDLGNTPGHVQHFSKRAFCDQVSRYLRIVRVQSPLPWTVIAAEPHP